MQQAPLLGPQQPPHGPSPAQQRRGTIGRPRKAPNEMPLDARPAPKEGAGDALLRMMHGERRGGEA
jgi:hypothetical protein